MAEFTEEELPENPHDTTYNADDPKQVNRARKKKARAEYESDEVLTLIMSQPNGRRWVNELINFSHPLGDPIALETHRTYYNIGAQQLGKKLLADLYRLCPDMYSRMLKEAEAYEKQ